MVSLFGLFEEDTARYDLNIYHIYDLQKLLQICFPEMLNVNVITTVFIGGYFYSRISAKNTEV